MTIQVPAACEPELANKPECVRLAVIIDQLVQLNGGAAAGYSFGVAGVPFTSADQSAAAAAITDAPGVASKLFAGYVDVSVGATAQAITLSEETSGTVIAGPIYMAANSTLRISINRLLATTNKKLMIRSSAAGNISALAAWRAVAN